MKLVIFDIDGTLTLTNRVDELCFVRAFADTHGINIIDTRWENCPHVTDSGLTHYIFNERLGRDPRDHEQLALKDRLVALLEEHYRIDPSFFAEVQGAKVILKQLAQRRDWKVAIATGCWRPSAEVKLRAADMTYQDLPAGFAEDGIARETIVSGAISRSLSYYQRGDFDSVVSVGDGVWDVQTAAKLGLAFIGIASGVRAEALRAAGARHIIPNFEDTESFFRCLEEAAEQSVLRPSGGGIV